MRQSNAAWMSDIMRSGSGTYSLGHLVSVNATPRASQRALIGLGAANCHIPGKFMSCFTRHIVVQVTRKKVSSDHHHAGKHIRVYHRTCSLQLT